jgi:hypothetical protein
MPDATENVADDPDAAISSAWAQYHEAKRRRHVMHEVVRSLWGQRAHSDFDDRWADITGREP